MSHIKIICIFFLISALTSAFIGFIHNVNELVGLTFLIIGIFFMGKNFYIFFQLQNFKKENKKYLSMFKVPLITLIFTFFVLLVSTYLIKPVPDYISESLRKSIININGFAYTIIFTQILSIIAWFIYFKKRTI